MVNCLVKGKIFFIRFWYLEHRFVNLFYLWEKEGHLVNIAAVHFNTWVVYSSALTPIWFVFGALVALRPLLGFWPLTHITKHSSEMLQLHASILWDSGTYSVQNSSKGLTPWKYQSLIHNICNYLDNFLTWVYRLQERLGRFWRFLFITAPAC